MKLVDHKFRSVTKGSPDNITGLAETLLATRSSHYRKVPNGVPGHIRGRLRFAATVSETLSVSMRSDADMELRFDSADEAAAWLAANPLQEG